jgi:hypothetical protein
MKFKQQLFFSLNVKTFDADCKILDGTDVIHRANAKKTSSVIDHGLI